MILNLTQHAATPEQIKAGVENLANDELAALKRYLTFVNLPTGQEIETRAKKIGTLVVEYSSMLAEMELPAPKAAMIGGAPFLMPFLEAELRAMGIKPLYAFSKRDSVEESIDGKTVKKSAFRHVGFVDPILKPVRPVNMTGYGERG